VRLKQDATRRDAPRELTPAARNACSIMPLSKSCGFYRALPRFSPFNFHETSLALGNKHAEDIQFSRIFNSVVSRDVAFAKKEYFRYPLPCNLHREIYVGMPAIGPEGR
jgi:hypothetical protein